MKALMTLVLMTAVSSSAFAYVKECIGSIVEPYTAGKYVYARIELTRSPEISIKIVDDKKNLILQENLAADAFLKSVAVYKSADGQISSYVENYRTLVTDSASKTTYEFTETSCEYK